MKPTVSFLVASLLVCGVFRAQGVVLPWYLEGEAEPVECAVSKLVVLSADDTLLDYQPLPDEEELALQERRPEPYMGAMSPLNLEERVIVDDDGVMTPVSRRAVVQEVLSGLDLEERETDRNTAVAQLLKEGYGGLWGNETQVASAGTSFLPKGMEAWVADDNGVYSQPLPWGVHMRAVPEPAVGALALLGVGLLMKRRKE